jgi:hypothetical protein
MADPVKLVTKLDGELRAQSKVVCRNEAYYEGNQPLRYMAPALEAEIGDRVTQLVINWPRMIADAYENLADVEGFRYRGTPGRDDELWDMWQANDGDELSQQAHLESLIHGRAFVVAGGADEGSTTPRMTVEHPLQMTVRYDPRTRRPEAGLKRWVDDERVQHAALYLPDDTRYYRRTRNGWTEDEGERNEHNLGVVPISVLLNRGRMLNRLGVSEFADIIPLADAANKMATDMMISGEFHAMPRRWVVGMDEDDFIDEDTGKQISSWSAVAGRLWASKRKPTDVKYGQFEESDLTVFHNTIKMLATLAIQLAFLPQDYLGFVSDNPPSADAVRATEVRKVKRAERQHTAWGNGWENHQRNMLRIKNPGAPLDKRAMNLETIWRDPSTPTVAQMADAVQKLVKERIIPPQQAREDLRYSPEQLAQMAKWDEENANRTLFAGLADQFRTPEPTPVPEPTGAAA